jgi:biopolymer transport protein ExbD
MDPAKLRLLLAAPVASLFLVLSVFPLLKRETRPSVGLRIAMPQLRSHSPRYVCEDDIPHLIRLTADGRTWFVYTDVSDRDLRDLLVTVNQGRHERMTYLVADPSVPFARVVRVLQQIQSSVPGMHVIMVTPELMTHVERPIPVHVGQPDYSDHCVFEWAENGFDAPSIKGPDVADPVSTR